MRLPKIDRRKLARAYDVALVAVGAVVAYLATDPDARAALAEFGGYATMAIGVANVLLNRLPKLPKVAE
jgi:hypothetical protein